MKIKLFTPILAVVAALFLSVAGCNAPAKTETTVAEAAKPDMAAVKAQIQAIETEWAEATSRQDIDKVMTFYSDDAIEMSDDEPNHVGKEAIKASLLKTFASRKPGTTVSFETVEVFGDGEEVTEVGKTAIKDAAGATLSTGRYVGIFEKRDGKYICVRDINNEDQKPQ